MSVDSAAIEAAHRRIREHLIDTPLFVSEPMSERSGSTISIQAEHQQLTGSFKIRGALNKVLGLDAAQRDAGIITASSGNHGIATATAARLAGATCTVYLPANASTAKSATIQRLGATVVHVDSSDSYAAEQQARAAAEHRGATYVSPYNDPDVVAGQGTLAIDLMNNASQLGSERIDAVVVAVGGGGLISGVATWLDRHLPDTLIIGASPINDRAMAASVAAGNVVAPAARPTFSDGTAGSIEPHTITFELCRRFVDTWIDVTEIDIATAVTAMVDDHHQLVEGAAGVAIAAAGQFGRRHPGSTVIAVSCGANVTSTTLHQMIDTARRSELA
ncbi:MAG: pyridoxal-phosphate dependent enzyme [Ilumatobacteraceae bacterium]